MADKTNDSWQAMEQAAEVAALCGLAAMVTTAALVPLLPRGGHSAEWSG